MTSGPPPPTSRPQVCKFHRTSRGCSNGANCKFAHEGPSGNRSAAAAASTAGDHTQSRSAATTTSAPRTDGKLGVCAYFLKPRGCVNGDGCRFAHELPSKGDPPPAKLGICKFDHLPGGCVNGANCRFAHESPSSTTASTAAAPAEHPKPICRFFGYSLNYC